MVLRLSLAGVLLLLGCEPVLSADTLKLVKLPADLSTGPAQVGVQTKEGRIFVTPISGGFLRLSADGGTWDELPAPAMQRFLPDFKDGLSVGQGANDTGLFRATGDSFVGFEPAVPALSTAAFSSAGWAAVNGRDATGVFWAAAAMTFGDSVFLAHLDDAAADWQYDELPITTPALLPSAAHPAMTSDGRFFFRPDLMGLWELDLPNHVAVERVPCDHELFRPSRSDAMPCSEDVFGVAGRGGELFILNASRELWRIAARGTTPTLAVKAELPKLDRSTHRFVGAPQLHVDPTGRVWFAFRWGENVDADTSWLYVAEPAKHDSWTFLKSDLPRTVALFGDGSAPLVSSGVQSTGLLVFRIAE